MGSQYGSFGLSIRLGIYNLLEATLIHTHLADHEFDKITQVVFQLHVHDEIPYKAQFVKEERSRCFKNKEFANASTYIH